MLDQTTSLRGDFAPSKTSQYVDDNSSNNVVRNLNSFAYPPTATGSASNSTMRSNNHYHSHKHRPAAYDRLT